MIRTGLRATLLLALLASAAVQAGAAADAFAAGRFAQAVAAGRAENTPEGRIIAGRALGIQAAWLTDDGAKAESLLRQSEAELAQVLKADPKNVDALLQHGIVVGYRAKLGRSPGLAKQARQAFNAVLARQPDDPLALAALGGWHGESVATLGSFIAGTALGAKKAESIRYFDKAMARNPAGPAVPTFYAFTLLALDAGNAPAARALLARADKAAATDGMETLLQRNARDVLALLANGDPTAARALAKRRSPLGALK